jgi:hypothetical protein
VNVPAPIPDTADNGRPFTPAEKATVAAVLSLLEAIHDGVHTGTNRRYKRPPAEPVGPSPAYLELQRLLADQAAAGSEARARAAEADLRAADARRAAAHAQAAQAQAEAAAHEAAQRSATSARVATEAQARARAARARSTLTGAA